MTTYRCTVKYCRIKNPGECARCEDFWRERAAIREIDGGMSREEAERLAMEDLEKWMEDLA